MALALALAVPGEAALVRALSEAAYVPAYQAVIGAVPRPATEDYAPRIKAGHVWLAREAGTGEAVGVLVLEPGPGRLTVYSVAVSPAHQGRGHGSALLAHAETVAARQGYDALRLYTNTRMARTVELYRRAGYVAVGERPYPSRAGETLVDMVKRLGA